MGSANSAITAACLGIVIGVASSGHAAVNDDRVPDRISADTLMRVADSDNFYTFDYSDDATFEAGNQRYNTNDGYITNFSSESLPLVPFRSQGKVYLREETVVTPGSNYRLPDGGTSLQIDFNF